MKRTLRWSWGGGQRGLAKAAVQGWRLLIGCLLLTCLTMSAPIAAAQETAARGVTLLLQPGMLSADFLSPPEGATSTTGFNLRAVALAPTGSRWFTFIVGANVTPYGTSGISTYSHNAPTIFAGNVFPVLDARKTAGWVSIQAPLLLTYSYGGGGPHNRDLYGKDIVAEAALSVHLGAKVLRELGGALSRLQVYFVFDQSLTPNEDPVTGKTDRFDPVAQYGFSIPIGGARKAKDP